jgi:hypothetical protein
MSKTVSTLTTSVRRAVDVLLRRCSTSSALIPFKKAAQAIVSRSGIPRSIPGALGMILLCLPFQYNLDFATAIPSLKCTKTQHTREI